MYTARPSPNRIQLCQYHYGHWCAVAAAQCAPIVEGLAAGITIGLHSGRNSTRVWTWISAVCVREEADELVLTDRESVNWSMHGTLLGDNMHLDSDVFSSPYQFFGLDSEDHVLLL
jgi:hypothetical protein